MDFMIYKICNMYYDFPSNILKNSPEIVVWNNSEHDLQRFKRPRTVSSVHVIAHGYGRFDDNRYALFGIAS